MICLSKVEPYKVPTYKFKGVRNRKAVIDRHQVPWAITFFLFLLYLMDFREVQHIRIYAFAIITHFVLGEGLLNKNVALVSV